VTPWAAAARVRLAGQAESGKPLADIYRAAARTGSIDRPQYWWNLRQLLAEAAPGPGYLAVHGTEGAEDGYVSYHPVGQHRQARADRQLVPPRGGHRAHRADRHRLDHVQRPVRARRAAGLVRLREQGTGGLERRHHAPRSGGRQLRPHRAARARRPLRPRGGVRRPRALPVRIGPDGTRRRPPGLPFHAAGTVAGPAVPAGPSGAAPGGRFRPGAVARGNPRVTEADPVYRIRPSWLRRHPGAVRGPRRGLVPLAGHRRVQPAA